MFGRGISRFVRVEKIFTGHLKRGGILVGLIQYPPIGAEIRTRHGIQQLEQYYPQSGILTSLVPA
jgi:hypothetical protein